MRVADLSKMEVRVNVNENDIVNVEGRKPGSRSASTPIPTASSTASVREIGASAANSGATGQATAATDQVTNFVVKIRVADKDRLAAARA